MGISLAFAMSLALAMLYGISGDHLELQSTEDQVQIGNAVMESSLTGICVNYLSRE